MAALDFKDVGASYDYPGIETYRRMGSARGTVLTRGRIWSVGLRRSTTTSIDGSGTDGNGTHIVTREINTKFSKMFQYNPVEVQMALAMAQTDPVGAEQTGGGVSAGVGGVGNMSATFQLRFTRDTEVYHAENGQTGGRYNEEEREVFRRIGVQRDVYDLYRVIIAGEDTLGAGGAASVNNAALPVDMSVSALTGKAYDLSAAGQMLFNKPVAVQFNEDLIFYGNVSSIGVVYNKFNFRMVPVWAQVALSLDIVNVRPLNSVAPAIINGVPTSSTPSTGGSNSGSTPSAGTTQPVIGSNMGW